MGKVLYDGFHKVTEVEVNMKGKMVKREKLGIKSAVGALVIDESNRMGLVTQYRPAIGQKSKEIPAGLIDKEGLTPIEILIEELEEECQIPREEILSISETPFHEYFMLIGSSDCKISLFEIRVKAQEDKVVDDVDVECVEWVDLETLEQWIKQGLIVDGKTLLAYYHLKLKC